MATKKQAITEEKLRDAYLFLCMVGKVDAELLAEEMNSSYEDASLIIAQLAMNEKVVLSNRGRRGLMSGY